MCMAGCSKPSPPAPGSGSKSSPAATCSPIPSTIPKNCEDAPKCVNIPDDVNKKMGEQWGKSFPGGKSQEQGGTLVRDKDGNLKVVNTDTASSTGGTFSADEKVPADTKMVGVFHTHPYDKSEGGMTNVSFSGGDIANVINNSNRDMGIVQSGDGQFLIMKTAETPASVDYDKLNQDQNDRVAELQKGGKSFDEASRIAAKETAQKYKMAYYEGKDGVLNRVSC